MAVLRIKVDKIREDELRVGFLHQLDRLSHAVGIRIRADLAIDADAIEDVGDFSESDDLLARLVRAFDDCLTGRPHGKILSIRGALEVTASAADKRPGDDASDVVLAVHHLASNRTDPPELFDGNHLFVRRNLKYRISRRVHDRVTRAHMLFAELVEDHRAGCRLVSERLPADPPFVFGDHLARKTVRIRAEGIIHDESHHLPMSRRRIFPRAHLGHPPECALRTLVRRRFGQRVQESKTRQVRQPRMLCFENVTEGVGAFVSEVPGVRQFANAEGIADDYYGAVCHVLV